MDFNYNQDAIQFSLPEQLPPKKEFVNGIRRAPDRVFKLSKEQAKTALKNALRYIPPHLHKEIAPEFMEESYTRGRIYGYRYRPEGNIKAKPVDQYKGKIIETKAFQVMIDNNLDFDVALYPYELVTYGESGQVFQNWMQYNLVKQYLEEMTDHQTLVIYSGHPLGLYPTWKEAPRVISTNAMLVGLYDNMVGFHTGAAMGVANYGQMTAGGWMYIGPQGIVHGTYITVLNAGRLYLDIPQDKDLAGVLYVSSGLGGMSGAQAKAVEIAGGIGLIAEVDYSRIQTRYQQGWVAKISDNLDEIMKWVDEHRKSGKPVSIAYYGNIVDLWEFCVNHDVNVELASDQTSCHDAYGGGYTPVSCTFEEGRKLLRENPGLFKEKVNHSLVKQFNLIKQMVQRGTRFWDYGNSFLKAVFDAGATEVALNPGNPSEGFIYPSYVEHIMGPMCFDYGYGPFRWVCLSGKPEDLQKTDKAAMSCIDPNRRGMDRDNYQWIKNAEQNNLVVGTQARILYSDAEGRVRIALKFNQMVRNGEIGPVMIGRDHHDVSGTDSPFRETANIKDGSNITADMAVHNFVGDAVRGMSMVVLSNGGGVGVGKAINGGFGLVLEGTELKDRIIKSAMEWDVMNGISRRAWARNQNALETASLWNRKHQDRGHITLPYLADDQLVDAVVSRVVP
ncbi:MAG: urocanate hydratase [Candidatus Aminicenantes bacterium]|nr:urocanate hydratase [Candidatus Aminicenantes bacterium]NIM79140.1 urocanate hydratase [Candidatus Aminicenantes bacterium]NIN18425.1 urocanate hydratase [Candidatus Aminicenantes bacterium]NIN42313.1 urocanate hydratase [Candidatus Aminicenantes bacterium]NIN85079.1 urocanate hydratase [Candidatus Aminicenantes bacterium]